MKRKLLDNEETEMKDCYAHGYVYIWWVQYNERSVNDFRELEAQFGNKAVKLLWGVAEYDIYKHNQK
jgi:hypothetical protein